MLFLAAALVAVFATFAVCGAAAAFEPLGYPWSTWGEVTQGVSGRPDEGLKLDFYAEQGIDWFRLGNSNWIFNTFAGFRGTISDRDRDFWNNKVGPQVGIKFKHPLKLFENSWGQIAIGMRFENYQYLVNGPYASDSRGVLFFQWSFGGDWKKSKK